jgi:hypothetical protein
MPQSCGTLNPMKMGSGLFILNLGPFSWTKAGLSLVL